ncbi:MAG TPA: thermonuclease family protein [Acidobacteriota bacterium]|nr:thermonuclease family protein [Acidobacteriota bacterium]HQG93176.1 thermonuclease family protein [Acidobacteriota bacterium]HQK87728.1 thermonuclease family protein [Acidobacteriota bacterium]
MKHCSHFSIAGFMRTLGVVVLVWPLLTGGSCDRTAGGETATADPPVARTERAAGQGERPLHFSGRVVAVGDGDTIDVLADEAPADAGRPDDRSRERRPVRVRLVEIDCPELGQPFGRKARQAASALCFGRTVRVDGTGVDTFGRVLGIVTLADGRSLNEELIRLGYAWWFRRYSRSETLRALEAAARAGRAGLWADRDPVPPWEWRDRSRNR